MLNDEVLNDRTRIPFPIWPLCRILSDGPAVGPARDILRKSVVILCVEEKALFGIIDTYLCSLEFTLNISSLI